MLAKFRTIRKDREDAFTLIELLVVILIIGILAAIAIPVFLNQRKTANDGAVESDVKNAALQLESWVTGQKGKNSPLPELSTLDVKTSDGVTLTASGTANAFCILGAHSNGKNYEPNTPASYDSGAGGLNKNGYACEVGMKIVDAKPVTSSGAIAPNGSGIEGEGASSADSGDTTNPDGGVVNADGSTTYPDGSVKGTDGNTTHPDGSVTDPMGNTIVPAGGGTSETYPTTGTASVSSSYYDPSYGGNNYQVAIAMTKNNGIISVDYTAEQEVYGQMIWQVSNLVCYPGEPWTDGANRNKARYFSPEFNGTTASQDVDLNVNAPCNVKSFTLTGTNYATHGYVPSGTFEVAF